MKKLYVSPHSKTQVILLDGVQVSQPWSGFPDHELSSEFKFDSDGIYDESDYWQEVLLSIQFKLDSGDEYQVHCRTGSLENFLCSSKICFKVHCRTGSLEK